MMDANKLYSKCFSTRQFVIPINFHLFAYSHNNPMVYVDPDGRAPYRNGVYNGDFNPNYKQGNIAIGPQLPLAETRNNIATPLGNTFNDLKVTSAWGERAPIEANSGTVQGVTLDGHNGMDFKAAKGTRVNSVMDGTVSYVDKVGKGTYGKVVIITHDNGTQSLYAHQNNIYVKINDRVKAGQQIGESGETGLCDGPHLHFGFDGNGDNDFSRDNNMDNPARLLYSGE